MRGCNSCIVILLLALVATSLSVVHAQRGQQQQQRPQKQTDEFLFATTFPSQGTNVSLAQVSTRTAQIVKANMKLSSYLVESYSSVAFNPSTRDLYLFGISGIEGFIHTVNADTLDVVNQVYLTEINSGPMELQFDTKLQKLYGVASGSSGKFGISQYDAKTGERVEVIRDMPEVAAVSGYCMVYDSINHRYFVPVLSTNATLGSVLYQYNVVTQQLEKKIIVEDFIQNPGLDTNTNIMYGVTMDDEFASLDLTTGKYAEYKLGLSEFGFRELGASGFDVKNGMYYVLYNNHDAKTHLIQVDVKSMTFKVWPWYNHIGAAIFVPAVAL